MKMKSLLTILLAVLLIAPVAMAKQITVEFEWTANTEPDVDKYNVYHKVEGQGYNYLIPIKTVNHPTVTTAVPFNTPDDVLIKNYFVIRAEDTGGLDSGDSNEVWVSIDLRPVPAPVIVAGVYNDVTKTVDLSWDQTDPDRIAKWEVYNATVSGGPYTKVGEVVNDGSPDHTISWTVPTDGTYYFTVIGFTISSETTNTDRTEMTIVEELFSQDSNELSVQVRVHPAPTKNFKVKIRIQ